jgi:glycerol uptake facilitator-like aquaporin
VLIVALIVVGLALLAPLRDYLWGAMINPVHNVALIVRGKGGGLIVNLVRMTGQLVGAVAGAYMATRLVPPHLQGWVGGSLKIVPSPNYH